MNKYGAKKTEYNGRLYASKLEAEVAQDLDLRMKAGEFTEVEPQFRIPLYVYTRDGGQAKIFSYVCDFRCHRRNGTFLLVEAKGHRTMVYQAKRRILEAVWLPDHPDYEFEEITAKTRAAAKLATREGSQQ